MSGRGFFLGGGLLPEHRFFLKDKHSGRAFPEEEPKYYLWLPPPSWRISPISSQSFSLPDEFSTPRNSKRRAASALSE